VPATATPAKPRNLETSKPEPPAASVATPTPGRAGVAATAVVPTAVRQATPAPGGRSTPAATPLPTLALPGTRAPTPAPPRATTPPTLAPTRTPAR
jgi:hypothetical protein